MTARILTPDAMRGSRTVEKKRLHPTLALDLARAPRLEAERVAKELLSRGGDVYAARQAIRLHSLCRIHGIAPDVIDEFMGADHARDEGAGMDADAQPYRLVVHDRCAAGGVVHCQCHLRHRHRMIGPRVRQPTRHHIAITDGLDLFEAELLGPLAMALMVVYADNFRPVFWWAVVPAAITVLLIVFAVQEPGGTKPSGGKGWPIRRADLDRMSGAYWRVVIIGVVFTMAQFSGAFLVLKGQQAGLPLALVPLVVVVMNLVYAILATPAGAWSDSIGRRKVLVVGLGVLVAADLALAFAPGLGGLFVGVALWGAYMGLSQGLLSALVADTAPEDLRGTAFGLFNLVTGGTLLAASPLAGVLWQWFGSSATFLPALYSQVLQPSA